MNIDSLFDGLGTELLLLLITILLGFGGYKVITHSKITQKQSAGKKSIQRQKAGDSNNRDRLNLNQSQRAGDESDQNQIG